MQERYKPGRELDALIAEMIFGLVPCQAYRCPSKPFCHANPDSVEKGSETKTYSTDISAAWEVVEKLPMTVSAPNAPVADGEYANSVSFRKGEEGWNWNAETKKIGKVDHADCVYSYGLTAPHAICLAALRAIEK